MDALRNYLLSIVAACLLYAVSDALLQGKQLRRIMRLIGGAMILLVVLSPLTKFSFDGLGSYFRDLELTTQVDMETAQQASKQAIRERVCAAAEQYIEENAMDMGITVQAKVTLSNEEYPVPERVTLIGSMTVQQVTALSTLITNQLGIASDKQEWKIYGSSG